MTTILHILQKHQSPFAKCHHCWFSLADQLLTMSLCLYVFHCSTIAFSVSRGVCPSPKDCWSFNLWSQTASFAGNHNFNASFKALMDLLTFFFFFTHILWDVGFTHKETWSQNQRHGSIIHSYYKNTASKDTEQIPISKGYAFSTSSYIYCDKVKKYTPAKGVKPCYWIR